jgi:exonuclease SbcC
MIPTFLRAKGYRSYSSLDLDLHGIRSMLLFGPKGAGKSSIPDMILWALTGRSTSADSRGHVKLGHDFCQVEFGFTHGGSLYRVVRSLSLKSARGKSDCQLQVSDGNGGWIAKTGKSIAETDAEIEKVIGMGYEALTCGPFSIQDESGKFVSPPPIRLDGKEYKGKSARLQVLIKMLGLSEYEQLRIAATSEARTLDGQAGTLETQVAAADATLLDRPLVESELASDESLIQTARKTAQEAQEAIELLTGQLATLQAEIEAGQRQCASLAADERAMADLEASAHAKERTLERYRGILDHRAEIEAKALESATLSRQAEALRVDLAGIEAEIRGLEGQKAPAVARLRAAKEKLILVQARLADIQKLLATRREQEARVARLRGARTARDTVSTSIKATDEQITTARSSRDAITATNAEAQKRRGEILAEGKKIQAQVGGLVPLIAGHEKRTAIMGIVPCIGKGDLPDTCPLLADARSSVGPLAEAKEQYESLCSWRLPDLPEIHPTESLDTALRTLTTQKTQQQGRLTALDAEIRTLTPAEAELAALDTLAGEVPRLEGEERQGAAESLSAQNEIDMLAVALSSLSEAFGVTTRALTACDSGITERAKWVALVPEITLAERELPVIEADRLQVLGQMAALSLRINEATAAQKVLEAKEFTLSEDRAKMGLYRASLSRARADEQLATDAAAQHRATLAKLNDLFNERNAAAKEANDLRTRHVRLVALSEAYKQIPVLIIDNIAVPVLEEETNKFLAKTSPSKMQVRLDTQKEIKSRDTLADGLEIYIRDVAGERSLDEYSGGQRRELFVAFRIAFAKLQARRSGVGIEMLFIDEAFDNQGEDAVEINVQALQEIQADFPFLSIISHVPQMRDVFPHCLSVSGGPLDSKVEWVTK